MKLLHCIKLLAAAVIFCCFILPSNFLHAKELPTQNYQTTQSWDNVLYAPSLQLPSKYLRNQDRLQENNIQFMIVDSIANAYSYYSGNQQPYIFSREVNRLITVKRGFVDIDVNTSYSGIDTKDNLFFRTSNDWGKTWSVPELIYNDKIETLGKARYPSCYSFLLDGDMVIVYTAPITSGTGWVGFLSGLYVEGQGSANSFSPNFMQGGKSYIWGTDAKIMGGVDNMGDPWALGIGAVLPPEGFRDGYDNANIAFRRTMDFADWGGFIPPATASDKFRPTPDNVNSRRNAAVNMRFGDEGKIYAGVFGGLINSQFEDRNEMGFTVSEDLGVTWSEINACPHSIVIDYMAGLPGIDPEACYILFSAMDMTALDNGNLSFVCQLNEDTTKTGRLYEDALHQIIEIYRENGVWGVREVGNTTGYVLVYADPLPPGTTTRTNQMGIELQVVRTLDGSALVAKWVDFVDVEDEDGTIYKRATNDVFVATRAVGSNKWSKPVNITESVDYDRVTWLPDYVPSNLTQIPLLKTYTMYDPGTDPTEIRNRQRLLEQPQWLLIGHFDLAPASAPVAETATGALEVTSIYPNPASDFVYINFVSPATGRAKVELFNLMGIKMMDVYEGNINDGLQSVTMDAKGLTTGTYYCVISAQGQKTVRTINIVR